jgi:hypothetical protein
MRRIAITIGLWVWAGASVARANASAAALAHDEPSSAIEAYDPGEAATRAAEKLLEAVDRIMLGLKTTAYSHATVVRQKEGHYAWDCSGMTNWLLRRVAPRAFAALGRERPVARSYWRVIAAAPTHKPRRGWQRIADITEVRPGDLFAWRRPPSWPRGGNTGHVGVVLERARPVEGLDNTFSVRIADATSLPHDDDSRERDGPGGFGVGTLLFVTDDTGAAWAYGWFGESSRGVIPTDIEFGRLHG